LLAAVIAFAGANANALAGEILGSAELRAILVGNTEVGNYQLKGVTIPYAEYFRKDGKVKGKDPYERYSGTYTVREGGCFYVDYEGNEEDGCYRYERLPDGRYKSYGPNGIVATVTILPQDAKQLDGY